jgi:hypothetical protein
MSTKLSLKEAVIKDPELGEAAWRDEFEAKASRTRCIREP